MYNGFKACWLLDESVILLMSTILASFQGAESALITLQWYAVLPVVFHFDLPKEVNMSWKVVLSALGNLGVWVQDDAFPTHRQILLQHTYVHKHAPPQNISMLVASRKMCVGGRGCSLRTSSGYVIRGMQVTQCDMFDSQVSSQLTLLKHE